MKKYSITVSKRGVRKGADHALQPSDLEARGPWISFHYSFTEVSGTGATARVRSKRASYENGRLRSESFEAELDPDHAERVLFEAQRRFSEQVALFVRSLFGFPALPRRSRSEWD